MEVARRTLNLVLIFSYLRLLPTSFLSKIADKWVAVLLASIVRSVILVPDLTRIARLKKLFIRLAKRSFEKISG